MVDFAALVNGFDFDLWANQQWLACLAAKGHPDPDTKVYRHILSASEIWLRRLRGESASSMPEVEPTEDELHRLHHGWVTALTGSEGDRAITYRRTTGEELTSNISDIARHVINHGTYHRGELRGLCRARGDEEFPETDYLRYVFQLAGK